MLREALDACRPLRGGELAKSIPELARADPELLAAATCTVAGEIETAGDATAEFTLQSIGKPFLYGWALGALGTEAVHARVGAEPTGDAFDSIVTLEARRHRPHNPMVNAGAIGVAGLFLAAHRGDAVHALRTLFGDFAGRGPLEIDDALFASERATAHRNRAIAHLMRHFAMLEPPVDDVLDLYFRQCALRVTCRDLAVMAATLAGGGVNPASGKRLLPRDAARRVCAVMATCGLYDASGRFAFDAGLPAKSGISGGILAAARGRLGVAAFSPRLDAQGNSVRGRAILEHVAAREGLHFLGGRGVAGGAAIPAALEAASRPTPGGCGGRCASYIAPLARVSPDLFGLAVCTVDGAEHAVGDAGATFTLQAVANPLVYALVAGWAGAAAIHERVGVEPSGNPFHAIVFDRKSSKPFNPLGNAGAIAVCSLVPGASVEERARRVREGLGALAGGPPLLLDGEVLAAERAASDRNHAIACLLRNFGLIEDEEAALDLYLQNCSLRSDCRTLARMGATLAAGGGRARLPSPRDVRNTLSLMFTCGLHDESGQFAVDVGIPAKNRHLRRDPRRRAGPPRDCRLRPARQRTWQQHPRPRGAAHARGRPRSRGPLGVCPTHRRTNS